MAHIHAAFKVNTTKDICLVVLVDGSRSVEDEDFVNAKTFLKSLIQLCTPSQEATTNYFTHISVVQFSTTAELVIEDLKLANQDSVYMANLKLDEMKQLKTGTKYVEGYSCATTIFARSKGRIRRILMVTDGKPNEAPQLVQGWIKLLLSKGIELYTVGIGPGVKQQLLDAVSSPGCAFHYNNYTDLLVKAHEQPAQAVMNTEEVTYDICVKKLADKPFHSRSEFEAEIEIKRPDIQSKEKSQSKTNYQYILEFKENAHFLPAEFTIDLEKHTTTKTIVLTPKSSASEYSIPEEIEWVLKQGDSIAVPGTIPIHSDWLVSELSVDVELNVLLFGHRQAGKSSFINGFSTCVSHGLNVLNTCAVTQRKLNDKEHGTVKFQYYKMTDTAKHSELNFTLWDIWGLSDDTKIDILPFLNGEVSVGASLDLKTGEMENNSTEGVKAKMDVVVIFAMYPDKELNPGKVAALRDHVVRAQRANYTPMLVVTYMESVPDKRLHEDILMEFSYLTGVPRNLVFGHSNYHGSQQREMHRDLAMWKIILAMRRTGLEMLSKSPVTNVHVYLRTKDGKYVRAAVNVLVEYSNTVETALKHKILPCVEKYIPTERDAMVFFYVNNSKEHAISDTDLTTSWGLVVSRLVSNHAIGVVVAGVKGSDKGIVWARVNNAWDWRDSNLENIAEEF